MEKLPRIPSPPGTVWREFRVRALPGIVFGIVLLLTVLCWRNYVGPSSLVGEAESIRASVGAPQAGRVVKLAVHTMDLVSKGQVLGFVEPADPRVLQASLALIRARIELLRTSPVAELRVENNRINYEHLRLNWLQHRVDLAVARSKVFFVEAEYKRAKELFNQSGTGAGLVSQSQLDQAKRNLDEVHAQIDSQSKLIEETDAAVAAIRPLPLPVSTNSEPSALRAGIAVEERNLDLTEAQLGPVPLISPIDGIVSAVLHREGESVPSGEPVLSISARTTDRIVAYIRQPLNFEPRVDAPVEVRLRSVRHSSGTGKILAVGTQLEPILGELLPQRGASGSAGPVEYGLPILVSIPPEVKAKLLPGEIVDLQPRLD